MVNLYHAYPSGDDESSPLQKHLLWDRKAEGGFPGMYQEFLFQDIISLHHVQYQLFSVQRLMSYVILEDYLV